MDTQTAPDELTKLKKKLEEKDRKIYWMQFKLDRIKTVVTPLASNRKYMQIAGPARQILNIINS